MTPNSYLVASRLAGHTDDHAMATMRAALVKALGHIDVLNERIAELETLLVQDCTMHIVPGFTHADK